MSDPSYFKKSYKDNFLFLLPSNMVQTFNKEKYEIELDVTISESLSKPITSIKSECVIICNKCNVGNRYTINTWKNRDETCCDRRLGIKNENPNSNMPVLFYSNQRVERNQQVNYQKVKDDLERLCRLKNGICLNINEYVNHQTKLHFRCNICKCEWTPTYNNLIHAKSWCPKCALPSINEEKCRSILEYLFVPYKFPKNNPDWLRMNKNSRPLELDCYSEDLELALEFNGIQHYEIVPGFHKPKNHYELSSEEFEIACEKALQKQKDHDAFKIEKCEYMGKRLITVSYLDVKEGYSFVKKKIFNIIKDYNSKLLNRYLREPSEEWLNSDELGIVVTQKAIMNKERLDNYINTKAIGYRLNYPDVIISDINNQYLEFICPKGHTWNSTMGNFTAGHQRRCITCGGREKLTIEIFRSRVQTMYPYVRVDINQEYKNTGAQLKIECLACDKEIKKSLDAINKNKRIPNKPIHFKCKAESRMDCMTIVFEKLFEYHEKKCISNTKNKMKVVFSELNVYFHLNNM
jgi:hypothetical protein